MKCKSKIPTKYSLFKKLKERTVSFLLQVPPEYCGLVRMSITLERKGKVKDKFRYSNQSLIIKRIFPRIVGKQD